jgi:hypothetical protein
LRWGPGRARTALADLPGGRAVIVIGGGLTGIETASEIAFGRPDLRVRIVGQTLAAGLSAGTRQRVCTGPDRLNVEVVEDPVTQIAPGAGEAGGDMVRLGSRPRFSSDLTLWAIITRTGPCCSRSPTRSSGRRPTPKTSFGVLRSAVRRRERYVGPWLPEPLVTAAADDAPDDFSDRRCTDVPRGRRIRSVQGHRFCDDMALP